jgi:RimJ/RimL family protein N-acetyltransferase
MGRLTAVELLSRGVLMETLETDRLVMREFRESDTDAYAEMCADEEVMRYVSGRALKRDEAWRQMAVFLGHFSLRGYSFWAVDEKATGAFVGRVGCWRPEGWPSFEVGWALARGYWGRGYATEAARAALDYAFERLGQARVVSLIHPENARSIRVAERIGERHEGEAEVIGVRALVYGVERAEWGRLRR